MEKQASIQFLGYKVKKSHIEFVDEAAKELQIGFEPSGIINNSTNIFLLTLGVSVGDQT